MVNHDHGRPSLDDHGWLAMVGLQRPWLNMVDHGSIRLVMVEDGSLTKVE